MDLAAVAGPLVYLLQCADSPLIQIGATKDLQARYDLLQAPLPFPLMVLGVKRFPYLRDAKEHAAFLAWTHGAHRVHGAWFHLSDEIRVKLEQDSERIPMGGTRTFRWRDYVPPPLLQQNVASRRRALQLDPDTDIKALWQSPPPPDELFDSPNEHDEKPGPNSGRTATPTLRRCSDSRSKVSGKRSTKKD